MLPTVNTRSNPRRGTRAMAMHPTHAACHTVRHEGPTTHLLVSDVSSLDSSNAMGAWDPEFVAGCRDEVIVTIRVRQRG